MVRKDLDRKFFIKHGMHMNKLGKERIALNMVNTVANILLKREKVISLQWKNAQGDSVSDSPTEDNVQWKNAQGDSVSDSPTEGNIPLQKDLEVTPSITTNVGAPLEVTAQDSVSPTEGNIPLQKDLEVAPSITTNVEAPLEVTAQDSVSDSPTEGNVPLQKDLEVNPSITNVEAPLEVTAQEEPRPGTSKRQK